MNKIIEADFLPPPVEEAEEKQRILIVDNYRDFTYSVKLGLERALHRLGRERTSQGSPDSATR
jgi:hypothetical protein